MELKLLMGWGYWEVDLAFGDGEVGLVVHCFLFLVSLLFIPHLFQFEVCGHV